MTDPLLVRHVWLQELCNCGNLHEFIQNGHLAGLTRLKQCLGVALDLCDGLSYMHDRHVLHLDLKPQNILLHRTGSGNLVCKIADFGEHQRFWADWDDIHTLPFVTFQDRT